uniref:dienelactone hydrolase family protein n=1 Tax=Arcanobacterium phocae TaxID=131112 RepID=UPI001C0F82FE
MSLNDTIPTLDGSSSFGAYVARPEGTPRAAIIVIQESFGVNPGIRQKCDKLAAERYLAVAPDLFWRIEPGIVLDPDIEPEFQRALGLFGQFDQNDGISDIEAT